MSDENKNLPDDLDESTPAVMKALRSLSVSGNAGYDELSGMEGMTTTAYLILRDVIILGSKVVYSVGSWLGGLAAKEIRAGIARANNEVEACFQTNEKALGKLIAKLSKGKVSHSVEFTAQEIAEITSTGRIKDLFADVHATVDTLGIIRAHEVEVMTYLQNRLEVMKKLVYAENDAAVARYLKQADDIKAPILKFQHLIAQGKHGKYVSEVLSSGHVFIFREDYNEGHKYSMSGDRPAGEPATNPYRADEWTDSLKQLVNVNEFLRTYIKAGESYVKFIQDWGDTVRVLSESMPGKTNVSTLFKRDIERLMAGDKSYLLFYSGFLPQVVGHANAFVADVTALATKLI